MLELGGVVCRVLGEWLAGVFKRFGCWAWIAATWDSSCEGVASLSSTGGDVDVKATFEDQVQPDWRPKCLLRSGIVEPVAPGLCRI